MDVELEKGAKTMHTYLIYIIQNLQEGENTGSYKKTHLPANVPWNQKIRMSKNDLHTFFNINCHLKHIFFHVPYFWQSLLTKSIKNVFVNWNKAKILDEQLKSWSINITKTKNEIQIN